MFPLGVSPSPPIKPAQRSLMMSPVKTSRNYMISTKHELTFFVEDQSWRQPRLNFWARKQFKLQDCAIVNQSNVTVCSRLHFLLYTLCPLRYEQRPHSMRQKLHPWNLICSKVGDRRLSGRAINARVGFLVLWWRSSNTCADLVFFQNNASQDAFARIWRSFLLN